MGIVKSASTGLPSHCSCGSKAFWHFKNLFKAEWRCVQCQPKKKGFDFGKWKDTFK